MLPHDGGASPLVGALVIALCVAGALIELPFGRGVVARGIQPAFVLMLFALPLCWVPLTVAACLVLAGVAARRPVRKLVFAFGDSWFSLGPVVTLAVADVGAAGRRALGDLHPRVRRPVRRRSVRHPGAPPALRRPPCPGAFPITLVAIVLDALLCPAALLSAAVIDNEPGVALLSVAGLTGLLAVLGREHQARMRHEHRALHDPLTGLGNRAMFDERVRGLTAPAGQTPAGGAVVMIDVDGFKTLNDTHGHAVGDRILRAIASRLLHEVRPEDIVARIGGDEFAVLVAGETDPGVVAGRLRQAFEDPLNLGDVALDVRLSVGVGAFEPAADDIDAVLAVADARMYADKRQSPSRRADDRR